MSASRDRDRLIYLLMILSGTMGFIAFGRLSSQHHSASLPSWCRRARNMRWRTLMTHSYGPNSQHNNVDHDSLRASRLTSPFQCEENAIDMCTDENDWSVNDSSQEVNAAALSDHRGKSLRWRADDMHLQSVASDGSYTAVLIVPTGIGAAIGGYAGDALPVARAMSSVVDNLVTHPNVMNGAMLYWSEPRIQYVEGYALDEFCAGRWGLLPITKGGHRIGLVLDCAIEEDLQLRHIQAANAARATLGINVAEYCITEEPAGVTVEMTSGGASWGTVRGIDSLIAAGRRLVEGARCTALAVVARFPDDEDEEALHAYREGRGVDTVGGAEAIISHVMSQELKVPCAHAPAVLPSDVDESVCPRAAAEELGYTFLPCVLANLHRVSLTSNTSDDGHYGRKCRIAPTLITSRKHPKASAALWADNVDAVVAPATAFGGAGVLGLAEQDSTLLIAVEENTTVMRAKAGDLLGNGKGAGRWVTVSSYLEAVGVLVAHKAGVNPACLTTHVSPARKMPSITSSDYGRARGDMLGRNTQFRDQRETLHAAPT